MWETCTVQLNVRLPRDLAEQAEEVQRTDPEFLSRVVLYGLTRRSRSIDTYGNKVGVALPSRCGQIACITVP